MRLVLVLFILLAVETYGVYGATMAEKPTYDCHFGLGILCFHWSQNRVGELLGEDGSRQFEERLKALEETWEREVVDRLSQPSAPDARGREIEAFLERLTELGKDGLERAREAADRVFEPSRSEGR